LPLAPLREWPAERTRHLLRHWLACLGFPAPGHRHLAQVESSLLAARPGRNPTVAWHGVELRRYRDRLHAVAAAAPPPPGEPVEWRPEQPLQLAHGVLSLQRVAGSGLASAAPLTVRYRLGGERLRPAGRQHTRSLKKLFQEAGIPPWCRARLPLLYRGDALVAVAGLWVAAEHAAAPGTRGWQPHWEEHALPGAVDHAD
jgi:tRNA(Ile)-lysidine synthase